MQFRCSVFLFVIGMTTSALADEGMWLFNAPPLKQLKEKYRFEPSPQWLEHLQKASVRFNSGGSGSFVSPNGLVITNHHVGADTLQKMGSAEHNYLRDGFYAKTQADEIKSTDLELNGLMSIEDVTVRVVGAVKPGMTSDQASKARNAAIAGIEKESKSKPDCGGMSLHSTKAVRTIFTGTSVMTTSVWFSPPSSKWPSSAVTPTTSSILGTISISAFFGCTKMANRQRSSTFSNSIPMAERRRTYFRKRQPWENRPATHLG